MAAPPIEGNMERALPEGARTSGRSCLVLAIIYSGVLATCLVGAAVGQASSRAKASECMAALVQGDDDALDGLASNSAVLLEYCGRRLRESVGAGARFEYAKHMDEGEGNDPLIRWKRTVRWDVHGPDGRATVDVHLTWGRRGWTVDEVVVGER